MQGEGIKSILHFKVTDSELQLIEQKQKASGITNLSAFLRRMILTGYVLKLDLTEIREMIRLMRNMTNNINQLTKRVNSGGNIYETQLEEIKEAQQTIWNALNQLLKKLESVNSWKGK